MTLQQKQEWGKERGRQVLGRRAFCEKEEQHKEAGVQVALCSPETPGRDGGAWGSGVGRRTGRSRVFQEGWEFLLSWSKEESALVYVGKLHVHEYAGQT